MKKIMNSIKNILIALAIVLTALCISIDTSEAVPYIRVPVRLKIVKYGSERSEGNVFYQNVPYPIRAGNHFGKFGYSPEEDKENFVQFYNNYYDAKYFGKKNPVKKLDEKNIKRMSGVTFKIYVTKSEEIVKHFVENKEKYSTPEQIDNFLKERIKNNEYKNGEMAYFQWNKDKKLYEITDAEILPPIVENGEVVVEERNLINNLFNDENKCYFTTDENGVAEVVYDFNNFKFGESYDDYYFWIVEDLSRYKGEHGDIEQNSAQPILVALGAEEEFYETEYGLYIALEGIIYAKNNINNEKVKTKKNINLNKTGETGMYTPEIENKELLSSADKYTSLYKPSEGNTKTYLSKDVSIDSGYVNWQIDVDVPKYKHDKMKDIVIEDYIDDNLEVSRKKTGKQTEDNIGKNRGIIEREDYGDNNILHEKADIEVCVRPSENEGEVLKLPDTSYNLKIVEEDNSSKNEGKYKSGRKLVVTIPKEDLKEYELGENIRYSVRIGMLVNNRENNRNYYNNHDVYCNTAKGKVDVVKDKEIPKVHTGKTRVLKINKKTKWPLIDARFILCRKVDFLEDNGKDVKDSKIEYYAKDGTFKTDDEYGFVYIPAADKFKVKDKTGKAVDIVNPKVLKTDKNGIVEIGSIQGENNTSYSMEEDKKEISDASEVIKNNFRIKYYLKEIMPPPGYQIGYTDNEILNALKNSTKSGYFNLKKEVGDRAFYVSDYDNGENIKEKDEDTIYPQDVVDSEGKEVASQVIPIENEERELPSVGGIGTILIILAGILMITCSTFYLARRKRKENMDGVN